MRSAKERTHERKRKREELGVRKTAESRTRRLANKAKRAEIISINSHAKIDIIDQETYVDGIKVEIVNNKIIPVEPEIVLAADEGEVNVMEMPTIDIKPVTKVESTNSSKLRDIFKKW